jgi:hypothetical protein
MTNEECVALVQRQRDEERAARREARKAYVESGAPLKFKMDRAARSLRNHVRRGNTCMAYSSCGVIDRYNNARDAMIKAALWDAWCKENSFAADHTAVDYFA